MRIGGLLSATTSLGFRRFMRESVGGWQPGRDLTARLEFGRPTRLALSRPVVDNDNMVG